MPQPAKANHLKVIGGSREPLTEPGIELPELDELPEAPDWLARGAAVDEWNRLGPVMVANRLLTSGNVMAFAHLCALHGSLVGRYMADEHPSGHTYAQYRNLVNDFGLTPVAQGKVKPRVEAKKSNPFAALKRA